MNNSKRESSVIQSEKRVAMAIKIGFFGKNDRDNYVNFIEKRWIRVANEFALPHQEIFLHRDQKIAKNRFINFFMRRTDIF